MVGLTRWGFRSPLLLPENLCHFYLGIEQHARQLTISLRDDQRDVVQALQVSTQPEKIQEFFERMQREFLRDGALFLAVVEVCGFNDWLLQVLEEHYFHKVILIQPEERKRQKTHRRDAGKSSADRSRSNRGAVVCRRSREVF